MPLPVIFLPRADRDLREIAGWLTQVSSTETAEQFTGRIVARCRELGDLPYRGRARPELGRGLRSIPFRGRATIIYRPRRHQIEIARIYYAGRDLTRPPRS